MFKNNHLPIGILLFVVCAFFGWTFAFRENEWLISLGINLLQISVGALSLYWLFKAYRSAHSGHKVFWLLLNIGVIFYLSSNWLWLYLQVSQGAVLYEDLSYVVWLLACLFFLAALVIKTKQVSTAFSNRSYLFNIIVFLITATSISLHFLIHPLLGTPGSSLLLEITNIIYPIVDLSILLLITLLYYFIQHDKQKTFLLFCIAGFCFQVTADLIYVYTTSTGGYQPGHFVDLLWLLALFFIGFTGYYANENAYETKLEFKNPLERKENLFGYTSIMILLVMMIHSYEWNFNALSAGLLVTFLFVLGRQIQILRTNEKLMSEFKHLAYHDPLTGLNNRRSFKEAVDAILENNKGHQSALLLIDLDRFKVVNDTLGHHIGDQILVKTAERLKGTLNFDASLFRIGGDEFIIALPNASEMLCTALAEEILKSFKLPLSFHEHEISLTPSIGVSMFPQHGTTTDELMKNADAAMYHAKESGKNGFSFYNSELNEAMVRKMHIENELRKAVQNEELTLFYQPKIDLQSRKMVGMEALLRWHHPLLGSVSPAEFIPVAEETGQIVSIGEWVLHEACRQNKRWQEKGLPHLTVSVNVSPLQFQHGNFLETVRQAIRQSRLEAQFLELEITESIMQNIRESRELLESLKGMGIRTSIDDFGTGYSSLSVLQKLPIDTIKIDKSFVDELAGSCQHPMIKTIIDLGLNMNLSVVAEGIETEDQLMFLKGNGCTAGQGYLFSRPLAPEQFEKMMQKVS